MAFNENQPRDPDGKFGSTGAKPEAAKSGKELEAQLDQDFATTYDGLPENERRTMENYTDEGYADINSDLRHDPESADMETVQEIDNVIARGQTSEDIVVFRAIAGPSPERGGRSKHRFNGLKAGDEFEDAGFSSTTTSMGQARNFDSEGTGYVLEVEVPKGTPGAWVPKIPGADNGEQEFILPRNARYRVISRNDSNASFRVSLVDYWKGGR